MTGRSRGTASRRTCRSTTTRPWSSTAAPGRCAPLRDRPPSRLGGGATARSVTAIIPSSRAFISDNMAGASPEIVRAVAAATAGDAPPYGNDPFTDSARRKLSEIFERDVDIFPVSTGTAANCLALATLTPPWGSVLCHPDSHINNDECGAPKFFTNGAKLVGGQGDDSKIDPGALHQAARRRAGDVHSVQPSVLSISQATESGSVYSLDEIRRLGSIARDAGLRVHMDGGRFANALDHLGATPAEMTWKAGIDVLSFGALSSSSFGPNASRTAAAGFPGCAAKRSRCWLLRAEAGREPHDRALRDLVGELSMLSTEFRSQWAVHDVRIRHDGSKRLWHPQIGDLELTYQSLDLPMSNRTVYGLTIYTAEPGSTSEERLKLLGSLAATQPAHPTSQPR
ncbi:beta-eliminating lyase-related protein [Nonomuraea sp. B12E4]|uniref:beta-eliminating lyase-related protein n=1 Tax=Nonomuraea sp. B12E4 TaxID=3153564 RepID=UPI00325F57F0